MRPRSLALAAGLLALAFPAALHSGAQAAARPFLDHAFVIVLENREYGQVIGNPRFPNLNRLAAEGVLATNFWTPAHPSLPNYVAMIAGSTFSSRSDDPFQTFPGPTLADQLTAKGLGWRGYFQGLPNVGFSGPYGGNPILYAKKHNPFMLFPHLANDPKAAANVRPMGDLMADLDAGKAPALAFIVPDLCHDLHGATRCPLGTPSLDRTGDDYVNGLVAQIRASSAWTAGASIVITFDEGTGSGPLGAGGRIPTIVLNFSGPRGLKDDTAYSTYSLLATLEDAWGLSRLRQAAPATVMTKAFPSRP